MFLLLDFLTLRQLLKMHTSVKAHLSFTAGEGSGETSPASLSRISLTGGQTRFSFISLLFASSLCEPPTPASAVCVCPFRVLLSVAVSPVYADLIEC